MVRLHEATDGILLTVFIPLRVAVPTWAQIRALILITVSYIFSAPDNVWRTNRAEPDRSPWVNITFCFHHSAILWRYFPICSILVSYGQTNTSSFHWSLMGQIASVLFRLLLLSLGGKKVWCRISIHLCSQHFVLSNNLYIWALLINSVASTA